MASWWSIKFMYDQLWNGQESSLCKILGDYSNRVYKIQTRVVFRRVSTLPPPVLRAMQLMVASSQRLVTQLFLDKIMVAAIVVKFSVVSAVWLSACVGALRRGRAALVVWWWWRLLSHAPSTTQLSTFPTAWHFSLATRHVCPTSHLPVTRLKDYVLTVKAGSEPVTCHHMRFHGRQNISCDALWLM